MSWAVIFAPRARRDLLRLDPQVADRVVAAMERLASADVRNVKRLRGHEHEWRLRIGSWRVRLEFDYDAHTIRVLRILPRGSAYRNR